MAMTERTVITGIRLDHETNEVVVSKLTTYLLDDVEITARLNHISYIQDQKAELEASVPNGTALAVSMGW